MEAQRSILHQLAKLTESAGETGDEFGLSVAMSGNTVVVGAPYATVNGNTHQGAAFIFVKPASGWTSMTETATLTASDGAPDTYFGEAVTINGSTIAVEAGISEGAPAYVFIEPAHGWVTGTQTAKLSVPSNFLGGGALPSVATNGTTIVLGEPWTPYHGAQFLGVAYTFVKPVGGWVDLPSPTGILTPTDLYFGDSVSISSDDSTIAVTNGSGVGVSIFEKPKAGWHATVNQSATLTASTGDGLQHASMSGDVIAAGAPGATVGSNSGQGAVYVFVKPATGWVNATQTAQLTASDGATQDQLGYSVSIADNGATIVAGAEGRTLFTGAAYLFSKPASGWANSTQTAEFTASDGVEGDFLGFSISLGAQQFVAGAPEYDASAPGAAYVFP